jgi:trimeric autotransporter adhesin
MKKHILTTLIAGAMIAMSSTATLAQGTIYTIAGTGATGYGGDNGPSTAAVFSTPAGVATDAAGNIYITDKNNNRVRMIDVSTGTIKTVAGNGTFNYAGMGGDATAASIMLPNAIAVDNAGNFYFTDWFADAAFKVECGNHHIHNACGHHVQGCGGDNGPGPEATMCIPGGIAVDNNNGNLYMVDYGNNRLRKLNAATNIVTTFVGGISGAAMSGVPANTAAFGQINGVCVDAMGNIYISDAGNHVVRRIDLSGHIRTIAGNGTAGNSGDGGNALQGQLNHPGCLFINNAGNLFICDDASNVVRVMNVYNGIIHTLAGTGSMGFSGDGGDPIAAALNHPTGVWQDASGKIYIADAGNQRVRVIAGSAYKTTGIANATEGAMTIFPNPSTGTFNIQTNSADNATVEVYNVAGEKVYTGTIGEQAGTVTLDQPTGIYNVMVTTTAGTVTEKVTIKK